MVLAIQSVVGFLAAQAIITGYALPTPTALADLGARWTGALESSRFYSAPVPPSADGVEPLLILGGLACLLLVDLLACSLRRVPLAGLPLLTIYTIPISLTGDGASWWVFAGISGGFVLMLFLQESEHLSRWGRTLGQDNPADDPSGFSVRTGDVRTTAVGIAAGATALALLLPVLIPTLSLSWFEGGFGPGDGDDLRIENPVGDLRRDLQRGADIPVLRITTADPDPEYLRIAVLTRLGNDEWSTGNRTMPQENVAVGEMPPLLGVDQKVIDRSPPERSYQVQVDEAFDSIWLPTSQNVSEINAGSRWRYDTSTMDFLAGDDEVSTSGMSYTFSKIDLDLSAAEMAQAPAAVNAAGTEYTALPSDLSPQVRALAREVTEGYTNSYQRAVALQDWFRDTGGFTYSLDVVESNGSDDLVAFLSNEEGGRKGYCEQFASAMAVMARTLRIPARVAVGFLRPEDLGGNRYEFSAHDMHMWPELYFPGSGWVRFEPTPAGGPEEVDTFAPAYTEERLPDVVEPSLQPTNAQPSEDLPSRAGDAPTDDRERRGRRGRRRRRPRDDRLAGAARGGCPGPAGRAGLRAPAAPAAAPRPALAHRWCARGLGRAARHGRRSRDHLAARPLPPRHPGPAHRALRCSPGRIVTRTAAARSVGGPRGRRGVGPDRARGRADALRAASGDRRRQRPALRHRALRGGVVRRGAALHPAPGALVAPVPGRRRTPRLVAKAAEPASQGVVVDHVG